MERSLHEVLEALSSLARTGWMLRGVPSVIAESVAEHSFWAAVLAFEISVRARSRGVQVDPYRAAAIALFHDIGESVIGDIPKVAGISRSEKAAAERRAVNSLPISREAKALQEEFEDEKSVEAVIARISESLATYLKALSYERSGYRVEEIRENMEEIVKRLAGQLGITDIINDIIKS
ncbi:MAG: HD family hydrolase [Desulfurococcales archaeon]|nr:HD family hydrolase [Desulfurococcales archaeon]